VEQDSQHGPHACLEGKERAERKREAGKLSCQKLAELPIIINGFGDTQSQAKYQRGCTIPCIR
jgi:hypothetical protein